MRHVTLASDVNILILSFLHKMHAWTHRDKFGGILTALLKGTKYISAQNMLEIFLHSLSK